MNILNYYEKSKAIYIIARIISIISIIGRKNKDKIIADFIEKLNIEKNDANNLYNVCMEFIVKNKFTK